MPKINKIKVRKNRVIKEISKKYTEDGSVLKNAHWIVLIYKYLSNPTIFLEKKSVHDKINNFYDGVQHTLSLPDTTASGLYKIWAMIPDAWWYKPVSNISNELKKIMMESMKKCNECDKYITNAQSKTCREWKGNDICDTCWGKYNDEREKMWFDICTYKPEICDICSIEQENNLTSHNRSHAIRFHRDHKNMFDKKDSICCMINKGTNIKKIYMEIDRCNILCVDCHHWVTHLEKKYPFTRQKSALTKKRNSSKITEEQYEKEIKKLSKQYETLLPGIYDNIYKAKKKMGMLSNYNNKQ